MQEEKYKLKISDNFKIISIKHSGEFVGRFDNAEGNPKLMRECWIDLAKKNHPNADPAEIKTKYNSLLAKFRTEYDKSTKLTGGAVSEWKYYNSFNENLPKSLRMKMEGVTDLGIDFELKDFEAQPVKKIKKAVSEKKETLSQKREKLYDAFITKLGNESENNKMEEKVNKLEKDMEDIKDTLNSIKNFLLKKD